MWWNILIYAPPLFISSTKNYSHPAGDFCSSKRQSDCIFPANSHGPCPQSLAAQGVKAFWVRDSLDWKGISASEITKRVTGKVTNGSIVLFHNAGEHTPEALPDILDYLLGEGYEIVPISKILLTNEETYIDHTGRQCRSAET